MIVVVFRELITIYQIWITEKSRFRNWLKRKKKLLRLILIPTKIVGSSNRNPKNQKSRKKRKNLKKKRKRSIKKTKEIKKTWFYMFIILIQKYLRSKMAIYMSRIYFRWVTRQRSKLIWTHRHLFHHMKENNIRKPRISMKWISLHNIS